MLTSLPIKFLIPQNNTNSIAENYDTVKFSYLKYNFHFLQTSMV